MVDHVSASAPKMEKNKGVIDNEIVSSKSKPDKEKDNKGVIDNEVSSVDVKKEAAKKSKVVQIVSDPSSTPAAPDKDAPGQNVNTRRG